MLTKIFLAIILAHALIASEPRLVKLGTRYEYFEPVTDNKIRHEELSTIDFKHRSKTFDSFTYNYPPGMDFKTIDVFSVERFPGLEVKFRKEVPENLMGLHRRIQYKVDISMPTELFNTEKFRFGKCSAQIIDYVDPNFYIDVEEIEDKENFLFIENERMDIEKMNSKSKPYYYGFVFKLKEKNTSLQHDATHIQLEVNIPFHLRYGEANSRGKVLYKLAQTFDLAINCIESEAVGDERDRLAQLREVPRYDWALKHAFGHERIAFFNLVNGAGVQNFEVFVGNTDYKGIVKVSTLVIVIYGMLMILHGIYSSLSYERMRLRNKQKID
jgi:hypothetical protein